MNEPREETVALRQAFGSRSEAKLPGGRCPEPDQLWATLRGELTEGERRDVIDHTARCPACAEDFRLAAHLTETDSPGLAHIHPVARRGLGARAWWLRGLAAAAVVSALAVGLERTLERRGSVEPPAAVHRADEQGTIQSLLEPDQTLPRNKALLRWSGPEGARFDVEVTTYPGLELVARKRGLESRELLIPEQDLIRLPQGARLLWHVEAVLPDGSRLPSPSFDLRLDP